MVSDGEGLPGVSLLNGMCSFPVLFGAHQKAIPEMSVAVCIVWGGSRSVVREKGNEQKGEEGLCGQSRLNLIGTWEFSVGPWTDRKLCYFPAPFLPFFIVIPETFILGCFCPA